MAIKADAKEEVKPIEVDINDASLVDGQTCEIDMQEDWQAKACPPPAGKYRLKLMVEDDKFEQGQKQGFDVKDPNGKYYKKQVTCKIQAEGSEWDKSVVFYSASTGVSRGKKMSTMAGLLAMMGAKLKPKMTELEVARLFLAAVKKFEPVLIADCDWSTWDRNDKDKGNFGGALLVGMKNFPLVNGKRAHIITNKTGEEFVAKLKIIKWLGKDGKVAAATATAAPAKAPVKAETKAEPVPVVENFSSVSLDDDGEVILDLD